jgi:acetyl esterase/lipase
MLVILLLAVAASAQPATEATATSEPVPLLTVNLWPAGKVPGVAGTQPEHLMRDKGDGFHRLTDVSRPTMSFYPATKADAPSPVMIVCPGGAYSYLVIDKEGTEIAGWLNDHGISALLLKYRTPHNRDGALQDAQRAISLARTNAVEWKIDPKRIGIIGFSAGGNLAAKASNRFDQRTYSPVDAVDEQNCRPDFAILMYPAYLDDKMGHLATDLNLKSNIPPTLIIHNDDDKTYIAGSKLYDAALNDARVPHEFVLYATGGHGYGLHCT